MRIGRASGSVCGGLLAAVLLAACGTAAPANHASSTSKTTASKTGSKSGSAPAGGKTISVAPLAPGASQLCSKPPTDPSLTVRLNGMGVPQVNPSDVALQAINENASGQDGPFIPASVDNTPVVADIPGSSTSGQPFTYGELYFSANGAVPAGTQNVMLCAEVYDAQAGNGISAQFSGNNPAGPVSGAYDAAPQAYLSSGSKKFYTLSFNFSGITFAKGGAGIGKENGSADFRINIDPITQGALDFKRVWLVTTGVPTQASLAASPAPTPLASTSTSSGKATGTLALQNCTPTANGTQWKVVNTDTKNPPTFSVPTGTPTIGSSLASWPATPMVQMGDCKTTEAWVYTMADSKNLYIAVKVQSVYPPVAGTDSAPWSGDVVQFAIDGADDRANHPGNPGGYDTTDDTEAGMVLLNGKGYLFADVSPTGTSMPPTNIPGSQVVVTRSSGVTIYEGSIPLSQAKITAGHTFGFNIAVSAGGPPYAAPYGFEWTHGIIGTKWPYAFAQLTAK